MVSFIMRNTLGKTIDYGDQTTTVIIISKLDKDGGDHFFTDVVPGQLLHLLEDGVPDNGLYEITSVDGNDPTDTQTAVTFGVIPISGFGEATVGDVARLRIFEKPTGGDASEFVKKVGDDMTGAIEIDDPGKINKREHLINKGYVDDELVKIEDNVDNIEQIQKYFLGIYSKGVYECPNFILGDPPFAGEYHPGTGDWLDNASGGKLENFAFTTNFEQVTALKISHIAGSEAKVDEMQVGDFVLIQETGTDSGGKYKVLKHNTLGTAPDLYEEVSVEFVEGFATGNYPANHNASIILFRESLGDNSDFLSKYGDDVTDALQALSNYEVGSRTNIRVYNLMELLSTLKAGIGTAVNSRHIIH